MHFIPPPELNEADKKKNHKRSRRMLKEIIYDSLVLLADNNHRDKTNFGVIKVLVDNHMYYYGIKFVNEKREVNVFNLSTWPTGQFDQLLENYWYNRNNTSVGVMIYKEALLPVFMENDELVIRQTWE